MKKCLCLAFAVLMAFSVLVGCNGKKSPSPTETTPDGTTSGSGTIIKRPGVVSTDYYKDYETDDLPETLNYGGYEFTMLCDAGQYPKSFVDTYTGDVINSALFSRKETVEKRLGISLNVVRETGGYANPEFVKKVQMAGESYDLVLAYNLTPATMAIQGLTYDLKQTKYLNFEKPWWSQTLLQNIAVNDRVYFNADNSSWNNLRNMLGIFVDKKLFVDNHSDMSIDTLYDLVENKQWTMDRMFELVEGCYRDTATPGEVTAGDTFGLGIGHQVWQESWFYAAGFTTMEKNESGEWRFTIRDTQVLDFVDKFTAKFFDGNNNCLRDDAQYQMFKDQRAQFYLAPLAMVEQELSQPFAVLPLPMYNAETQDGYRTHFSNTYDMYCIPSQSKDPERSSAVLECLASEAYRRVAPAYFEVYLKSRNVSDGRLADMYDIIRSGIVFDTGCLFGELFVEGNNPIYYVRRALNKYIDSLGASWTNDIDSQYLNLWKANVKKLTEMSAGGGNS